MKLFVYTTKACKDEADLYGKTDELERNAARVERTQDSATTFPEVKFPYVVDKHGGSHRWVAREYTVTVNGEDYSVLVILKLFKFQDKEYDSFNHDAIEYGKKKLEPLLNEGELENYVQARIQPPPPPPKDILTEEEIRYLNEAISKWSDETMIYESEEWVGKMEGRDRLYFAPIRDAVETALEDSNKSKYATGELLSLPTSTDYHIAYQWVGGSLYLYDCYLQGEKPNGGLSESDIRKEQILERVSFRTYPSYFLYDLDLWANVEQDRKGNFSLSPEEYGILYPSLRKASEIQQETSVDNQIQFPKFIKGRAGSGKSTVLQYLYAEYFARWARVKVEKPDWNDLPPSYLACNKELVDKARSFVESILRKNHSYQDEFGSDEKFQTVEGAFKNAFMVFHEYLLSLVPSEDRNRLFPKDSERHIDFSRFRKLWEKQFKREGTIANEKYGPDISWHVIRSFIKGHTANAHLTPEQYSDGKVIPRDRQSVTYETFEIVYNRVWKAWYEPLTSCGLPFEEDSHCWDDQDLVRYVINHNLIDGCHLGMFCDEAQDFTSIEIEAVFKMSVFSNRKVDSWDITKVPMVFAGDEFQTLNPTGFSWPAIQAAFTEKFILGVKAYGNNKIIWDDVRFDLKSNYRSLDFIVRFCNSVQLLRSLDSDGDSLVPQIGWRLRKSESDSVPFFPNNSKEFWDAVRMSPNIFTIIFPCLSNEEKDYLDNHKELRSCVLPKDGQTTMPPTLSTIRAKGLDYPNVIVYGFGEYMAEHGIVFDDLTEKGIGRTIALEYFINRLYVAVSRPRDQLFILDTERGRECLWKTFFDVENIKKLFVSGKMSGKAASQWIDSITGLRDGTVDDVVISGEFDNVSAAKDYEEAGMRDHDSTFMSYAKQYYERGQKPEKARWCEAWSQVFDADVKDGTERLDLLVSAAKMFEGGGFVKEAGNCYWACCDNLGWKNMASLMEHFPEPAEWITNKTLDGLSFRIAYAISNMEEMSGANVPETVGAIADAIRSRGSVEFVAKPWRLAIVTLLSKYANNNIPIDSGIIADLLTVISSTTVDKEILERLGDKCYQCGDFQNAIKFYEIGKLWKNTNYKVAKFKTTSYPECVEFRTCEADDKVIFNAFLASPGMCPSEASKRSIVAKAVVRQETWGNREELSAVVRLLGEISDSRMYEELAELPKEEKIRRALYRAAAVKLYERLGHGEALNALMTYMRDDKGIEVNRDAIKCGHAFVICLLARIADAPESVQKPDQGVLIRLRQFLENFLGVWGNKKNAHTSFEVTIEELEKVVVRYFDDANKRDRLFYQILSDRLGGIDVKRKSVQECKRFDWQTLFESIFKEENFFVRHVTKSEVVSGDRPKGGESADMTKEGGSSFADYNSEARVFNGAEENAHGTEQPVQKGDDADGRHRPQNETTDGLQSPVTNDAEGVLPSESSSTEDVRIKKTDNGLDSSNANLGTIDKDDAKWEDDAWLIEEARKYHPEHSVFCGVLRKIRDRLANTKFLAIDVFRQYDRCNAIRLNSPSNVVDGELVVGYDGQQPFLFSDKRYAAVQVVHWDTFVESNVESNSKISAIEYFRNKPEGELNSSFPYFVGNLVNPGHVVIADGRDTFLQGFLSLGDGKIRYSQVKQYKGDFDCLATQNQEIRFHYRDHVGRMLIPERHNKYSEQGQHAVLDCEGWEPLAQSEVERVSSKKDGIDSLLPDNKDGRASDDENLEPQPVLKTTLKEGRTGNTQIVLKEKKVERNNLDESSVREEKQSQTEAKPVAVEPIHVESPASPGSESEPETTSVADEITFLKNFAKYVERCGFVYSPRDLVRFHTSVKCCMFTLLGGTPGNGKSSLAKLYFQMLTGSAADSQDRSMCINVQPTWLEASDLEKALGVQYTNFLKACREEGKDKLYCVCFEEVNLARIEHYMADIIQEIGKRPDVLESEMSAGKCKLPPNIRFVGTCNEDASVQPISRRFYDRCNKIELSVYNREAQIANAFGLKDAQVLPLKLGEGGGITYADFKKLCQIDPKIKLDEVKKTFDALLPELKKIDAHPSPRVIGEIARYVALRPAFDVPDGKDVLEMALDEAIVQRILPCCQPSPATIKYYGVPKEEDDGVPKEEDDLPKKLREHHMDLSAAYVESLRDDYYHMMMA